MQQFLTYNEFSGTFLWSNSRTSSDTLFVSLALFRCGAAYIQWVKAWRVGGGGGGGGVIVFFWT